MGQGLDDGDNDNESARVTSLFIKCRSGPQVNETRMMMVTILVTSERCYLTLLTILMSESCLTFVQH